jgi:hypothetical protein
VRPSRFIALYRRHFREHRRERMFLASASFFVIFGATRFLIHRSQATGAPIELWIGGIHVHHYVWGIALLLLVGYLWLIQVGTGMSRESHRLGRITAVLYGVGAAMTLDEFAMLLHLEDRYWGPAGRASRDAVMLFGALVSAGLWGGPFWRALLRQSQRVWRKKQRELTAILGPDGPATALPTKVPVLAESIERIPPPPVLGGKKV